jgi:16S rRNA U516 pseudouridylate synthase RsuA-like enzyme
LREGVELEDGLTSPAEVRLQKQSAKTAVLELTIREGRKRQIKRMLASVGLSVEELHRRRFGPLGDKGLQVGASRELSGDEVDALRRAGEGVRSSLDQEVEGEPMNLAGDPPAGPQAAAGDTLGERGGL